MLREVIGIYKLTRWKEHFGTSIIVTALGLSIAAHVADVSFYRALIIFVANFLCFTFCFMINDIEDAEDDVLDETKSQRNPVSARLITKRHAYIYTSLVGLVSLTLFATLGETVFLIGTTSLILGLLYSWKRIRLKAWPVVDLVSHALFLGSLEFLAASLVDSHLPPLTLVIWLGFSLFIFSILGDIYNELRDFEADKRAGLRNTAQIFSLKRYGNYLTLLRLLPSLSIVLYLLLTFSFFTLFTSILFSIIMAVFYFFHGYKNGRSYLHPLYCGSLQAGLGILLIAHSV